MHVPQLLCRLVEYVGLSGFSGWFSRNRLSHGEVLGHLLLKFQEQVLLQEECDHGPGSLDHLGRSIEL